MWSTLINTNCEDLWSVPCHPLPQLCSPGLVLMALGANQNIAGLAGPGAPRWTNDCPIVDCTDGPTLATGAAVASEYTYSMIQYDSIWKCKENRSHQVLIISSRRQRPVQPDRSGALWGCDMLWHVMTCYDMLLVRHLMTIDFQIGLGRFFCCCRSKSWVATLCNDPSPSLRWMSSSKRSTSHPRSAGCATVIDGHRFRSGLQSPCSVLAQDFIHHWRSMVLPCVTMCYHVLPCCMMLPYCLLQESTSKLDVNLYRGIYIFWGLYTPKSKEHA